MVEPIRFGVFVWDGAKDRANFHRHGLGFSDAVEAFADPRRIVARDDKHSRQEERLFCIGLVKTRIATVRFTYRGKTARIFGAGYWRKGRKLYEETNPD
jgi:hypothetical protein